MFHASPAVAFLILVVARARSTASELDDLAKWRGGPMAGTALHMLITGSDYLVALVGTLSLLAVPVGHFLLGGFRGVVVRIAAQQSLGNGFAGFVLLLARPISVGNYIRVRSGARWRVLRDRDVHEPDVGLRAHGARATQGAQRIVPVFGRRTMATTATT